MYVNSLKVINWVILTIFWLFPILKPCALPKNKTKGSYSPKNPSKLVISPTKKYIYLEHWWSRSVGKLHKRHFNLVILTNFGSLFPTYKLPKLITLTENVYISIFHVVEMHTKCPKVVYQFILTNLWTPIVSVHIVIAKLIFANVPFWNIFTESIFANLP